MNTIILEKFKVALRKRLVAKTSWGRNEVYVEVLEALVEAITRGQEAQHESGKARDV